MNKLHEDLTIYNLNCLKHIITDGPFKTHLTPKRILEKTSNNTFNSTLEKTFRQTFKRTFKQDLQQDIKQDLFDAFEQTC